MFEGVVWFLLIFCVWLCVCWEDYFFVRLVKFWWRGKWVFEKNSDNVVGLVEFGVVEVGDYGGGIWVCVKGE